MHVYNTSIQVPPPPPPEPDVQEFWIFCPIFAFPNFLSFFPDFGFVSPFFPGF